MSDRFCSADIRLSYLSVSVLSPSSLVVSLRDISSLIDPDSLPSSPQEDLMFSTFAIDIVNPILRIPINSDVGISLSWV